MARTHETIILLGAISFSSACAEDALLQLPDPVTPEPTIAVSPPLEPHQPHDLSFTVEASQAWCSGDDVAVSIQNNGFWTVYVESIQRSHPESMEIIPVNRELAPGEVLEVSMHAAPGTHDFEVTLRDHDTLDVSLVVAPRDAPRLTIVEPVDGAILAEAGDVDIVVQLDEAYVTDDERLVTLMDALGHPIATIGPSDDGLYRYTWLAAERPLGEQTLRATSTASCDVEVSSEVQICQDATLKTLGVWQLTAVDAALTDEAYLGEIWSFEGDLNAADNFNYYSASAHPIVGPVPTGFETHVFFYEGPDGLTLNFFSNKDEGGHADWVSLDIDIQVTGNGLLDDVILSDDSGELSRQVTAMSADASHYNGRFRYVQNTDGGVIGPLAGEDFEVRFTIVSATEERGASFYSSNGTSIDLMTEDGITSFAIAYRSDTLCGLFGGTTSEVGPTVL